MKVQDLINKVRDIAINYKTLYVYGCFGSPLNDSNKYRYTHNYAYNEQPERANKIWNASWDTFGFDCVNLIKGVLWGWCGDPNLTYGGAEYGTNGVPDTNANGMFWDYCYEQSDDFSNIIPGEFVWMEGHIGVYIGDGYVVECSPIWNDGVMITYLGKWGSKDGYASREWSSHGKSKFIDYTQEPTPEPTPQPVPIENKYINIPDWIEERAIFKIDTKEWFACIKPKKFGGLSYKIYSFVDNGYYAEIETRDFGRCLVRVTESTPITNVPTYKHGNY